MVGENADFDISDKKKSSWRIATGTNGLAQVVIILQVREFHF